MQATTAEVGILDEDIYTLARYVEGLEDAIIAILHPPSISSSPAVAIMLRSSTTELDTKGDAASEPHFLFKMAGFTADGKQRRRHTKYALMAMMVLSNIVLISLSWAIPKIWYIFIPFCACISFMNTCMVLSMTGWLIHTRLLTPSASALARLVRSKEVNEKADAAKVAALERKTDPCTLAYVVPCYNESEAEVKATVESLYSQAKVEQHRKLLIVFCDGHVKGAGESLTTADMLLESLFAASKDVTVTAQRRYESAYRSWTGTSVSINCQWGEYKGLPYLVINKDINRGKRDTLIALRSLLYAFNHNRPAEETIFSEEFLKSFGSDIAGNDIRHFDYIVGTDADTTFSDEATAHLIAKVRENPKTVGVSGVIRVAFRNGTAWRFWSLYQNAEYLRAQALRRTHQSEVTHKVTCLPGACQILKVVDETCGDKICVDTFGYYPTQQDSLAKAIRAFAGEDRNHVVNMFNEFPESQTRMCWSAHAYTDPPQSFKVFLSQRRRWTLSTSANDLVVLFGSKQNIWERFCAFVDIAIWAIPFFIFATLGQLIRAIVHISQGGYDYTVVLSLSSMIFLPWCYTIVGVGWANNNAKQRVQYALGLLLLFFCGPFMGCCIIAYAVQHADDFSWGRTRALAADSADQECIHGSEAEVEAKTPAPAMAPPAIGPASPFNRATATSPPPQVAIQVTREEHVSDIEEEHVEEKANFAVRRISEDFHDVDFHDALEEEPKVSNIATAAALLRSDSQFTGITDDTESLASSSDSSQDAPSTRPSTGLFSVREDSRSSMATTVTRGRDSGGSVAPIDLKEGKATFGKSRIIVAALPTLPYAAPPAGVIRQSGNVA
ncbi:hypothetical protein BDZ90DRAFT_184724 [Jaminaea rosea]|uniref:chitin synthase n=1 Tax=Jaminaea rosea TaxID=1569628 RepID=A0A316UT45_9BASI|nr:hypothetical protein BDZ90DRAFT_184724 [Jaminaea rosea]PWN27063.1 hypothetical protein BDZ90DRAFT_184724 [Jaminaea rosea]